MSISKRIQECINKLQIGDAENAFIQLAIAIDGTAKKEYPNLQTTKRCKLFLTENLPFVMWSLTNGTPTACKKMTFEFVDSDSQPDPIPFEDVVYRVLRCSLLHEGEMPQIVQFTDDNWIAMKNGVMHFPLAIIGALLFAVIASPVNSNETVPDHYCFMFGNVSASVNEMLGDIERSKELIRNGFQYDVEKLIEQYEAQSHNKAFKSDS